MVIDTSAIVAAITGEPDAAVYQYAMLAADSLSLSAVTALEARIVLLSRFNDDALLEFERLIDAGINVVPFDSEMTIVAFDAFRRYGKGRGSPARLNFGDCAAYALAKISGEPLLFKGDDFSRTDIVAALAANG